MQIEKGNSFAALKNNRPSHKATSFGTGREATNAWGKVMAGADSEEEEEKDEAISP